MSQHSHMQISQRSGSGLASPLRAGTVAVRAAISLTAALALMLVFAVSAFAGFEQVATFGQSGEGEKDLIDATGVAVNYTGAGGIPPGTIYTVSSGSTSQKNAIDAVARWSPTGELREEWGWGVGDGQAKLERCGPDGEPAFPKCAEYGGAGGEGEGELYGPIGIAVDQSTGDVYVRNSGSYSSYSDERAQNIIQAFTGGGSLVAGFGDFAKRPVSVQENEESPEKIHENYGNGITVDPSGDVYVSDDACGKGRVFCVQRVMVWRPQGVGDYEHYTYAGSASDIPLESVANNLQLDDDGNLYGGWGEHIVEIAPGEAAPKCEFEVKDKGLEGMAVDPATGEVFYWDLKTPDVIHQLSACNAQGEFVPVGEFEVTPHPNVNGGVSGLAFNPDLEWGGTHPAGVLYLAEPREPYLGWIFAPAEAFPPVVGSESASQVTATSAEITAQVDPKGNTTHYRFQYETAAEYEAAAPSERFAGATEAPVGGGTLPAVQGAVTAGATVGGLEPDTEYRFRVLVGSHCELSNPEKLCEAEGEPLRFHTFESGDVGLPDRREWELVSPVLKGAGEVFPLNPDTEEPGFGLGNFPKQSSLDGGAVVYEGFSFSPSEGAILGNEYVSRRTVSGWRTTELAPLKMAGGAYDAVNSDLTSAVLGQRAPSLTASAPSEYANLYLQGTADAGALTPLVASQPPDRGPYESGNELQIGFAGASADLSRVFFEANDALTSETPYAPAAVDPGGNGHDLYEWSGGQLRLVNVAPGNGGVVSGASFASGSGPLHQGLRVAISADGSRAFFTDGAGQLYVRVDGERTLEVHDSGTFLTASENGSRILLSDGCLYSLEAESCEDVTGGKGGLVGIAGQSDDLSRVYFVDTAVLSGEEQNEYGAKAQAGKPNLYSWHEGQLSYIATVAGNDAEKTLIGGDVALRPSQRSAQASPDGHWLVFLSRVSLTGYDNSGLSEAFVYDSATGGLRCASCNPTGERPVGATTLPIQAGESYLPQPRYVDDSGRVFFDSQDALSPLDTNGTVEDVYEYEPAGVGSCTRQEGCVSLISGGREGFASSFLAADESGANVFFTTRDQLVPEDRDDLIDLYDAREGGGFPAPERQVECLGEACQPAPLAPNDPALASAAFQGAGNLMPQAQSLVDCPKQLVAKGASCVKPHATPKHRPSKHPARKRRVHKGRAHKSARARRRARSKRTNANANRRVSR